MKFINGTDRDQLPLFTSSIEGAIAQDNEIRLIDLFVDSLKLPDFGFYFDFVENGRPAYHPSDLLKLFIYGYLNRIRSSRALEKECLRNIELMWLLKGLVPDHNTIANFRKDNPKPIAKVFRATVKMASHFDLIGGTLVAGDSTKLRAQNSKKNNFNPAKIERHIAYIDARLEEYASALAKEDGDTNNKRAITEKITKHRLQKQKYLAYQNTIDTTGVTQISTSDPDSRQIMTRNNISEVAYTVQTIVDARHNIPIDFKVTNENDSKAMGGMLRRTKTILRTNAFTALFDKGYHTGSEFKTAGQLGIKTLVAIPGIGRASQAPDTNYNSEHFAYSKENDTYTCPQGNILKSNGSTYKGNNYRFKQYKTNKCKKCPVRDLCTTAKANGKTIQRSEYQHYVEQNALRMQQHPKAYRKRQAIVEHPYGVIKRQWGFYYIMTKKTIEHASADVGLIFTAYNLRRLFNLIGHSSLKDYLKRMWLLFSTIAVFLKLFANSIINGQTQNIYNKKYFNVA